MPDISAKIKGLNVEFNDNLTTSPNIDSGDDIKTSFARIHKRFSDMKTGAYEDIANQYYPSGDGSEKLVTGEIVQSAIESVSGDIEYIEYALKNLSKEIYNNVEMPITTGYYISGITEGDDWTQHLDADSSSQYLENAFYLGARQINKKLKFTVADHRSTSGRCFGFCDENNIVTSYYKESWDIWEQNTDGTYTATLPISGPYFFLSYSDNEIIGFEISEELINQTGYVSPNGSDSNGGSSFDFAFKTINKALSEGCTRIILDGGAYYQRIDLSPAHGKHIDIISYDRAYRPVFYDPNCILAESATLSDGVYSATIDQTISSGNWWLYQEGIPDIETQIAESERLPVQRGKTYRLDDTRIEKCYADNLTDALAEIKSSSIYKWYLDSNTLYFTAPTQPSQTNPICFSPGNDLFSGADRSISIRMSGIQCKYISLNLKNLCNAEAIDCCVTNIFGWGAITWDNTLNAYFLRCEASSCKNDTNGDGFNADVTNTGEAFSKHYTSTLIDCWSHDNTDDGYSDHRHAESTIIGGLFEYNGKAGLTPVYGAHCSCYNVYSRKNYTGFMCTGDVEEAEGGKFTQMICYNCVAELNNRAGNETGFYVDGTNNRMTLISCKAIGNPTAYYVGETASIKLVDCTAFDNNRFIHGYPENATVENTGLYRYIPQYSDLNDFTGNNNVGSYLCPNSRVSTITNKPESITTAFKMDITFYNDQTMQMIYPNDNSCVFYVRIYNNSSWSDWIKSSNEINTTSPITKSYSGQDITIGHATSGITAGTYKSVTVNETGHITSGSNPSTISGYGITDAKIQNGTITLGSNILTPPSQEEVNVIANAGAKNVLQGEFTTQTLYNVEFTVNSDGTITATSNGAATASANLPSTTFLLKAGTYIFTSAENSQRDQTYDSYVYNVDASLTVARDNPNESPGNTFTLSQDTNVRVNCRVAKNYTASNLVFKPMIRRAEITDATFVPYAKTNVDLTNENENQQLEINYAINTGAKNLFDINTTAVQNHVTSTLADDTLTVTSNGNWAHYSVPINLTAGDYIFTTTISNFSKDSSAGATSVRIRIATSTSGGTSVVLETVTGNGPMTIPFTSPGGQLYVQFYPNYSSTTAYVSTFTANNVMIRDAVIKSTTYEPYAPTNRKLYETKAEQSEVNVITNLGAKNLLKITASSQTIKGVTFTVNDDQTVTVNGTNDGTGASTFVIVPNAQAITIPDGNYILSGCPAGGGNPAPYDLRWYLYSSGKSAYETGSGALIEKSGNTTSSNIAIVVKTGQTANNLVFKPMLRLQEVRNSTFEPYAPTNRELYETKAEQTETNVIANLGAKNMLKVTASSGVLNTATIDISDDGSIHISGQPTGNGAYVLSSGIDLVIPENSYILSMGAEAGNTRMSLSLRRKGTTQYVDLYRAESRIIPSGTYDRAHIYLYSDTAYDTTVYPMIRRAEITDSTYVPYAPTNRELYELCETKASLNDIYGIKNQLPNGTDLNNLSAGIMMCPGATVAATLINCPTTTDAFIIYTDYLAATSRVIQRIYSFSTTTGIPSQYMRVRWSQGWTPWYQVTMQQVASASTQSVNQVSTLNLSRNDLNESLDTDIESLDSTPDGESESYNIDEELTEDESEY